MRDDIRKLLEQLKLNGMAACLDRILDQAEQTPLSVPETLRLLLQEECLHREDRSLANRLKHAKFPWDWSLKTFPFDRQPGVNQVQIKSLATLDFVARAQNIVFIGPPGTGKTGLAIGLLRQALINGYRGQFCNAQELVDELYASLADRSTTKLLNRLSRYDVLLIDELGYLTLKPEQVNAFFKLLDMRYGKKPTIFTTNLGYDQWYSLFQRKSLVDALLDRLRHHCITICIDGPSLRTPDPEPPESSPPTSKKSRKKTPSK